MHSRDFVALFLLAASIVCPSNVRVEVTVYTKWLLGEGP